MEAKERKKHIKCIEDRLNGGTSMNDYQRAIALAAISELSEGRNTKKSK